jgi:hypothetical protein
MGCLLETGRARVYTGAVMDERAERIGLNEALFREVNERVKGINDGFGARLEEAEFVCECGYEACTERIRMPLASYEKLRSEPTHFAVLAGHEIPDVETVLEHNQGYVVVEKKPGEAAKLAEETDPRS